MNIEESKKRNVFGCVYCITFPNGMKYVGKTKDFRSRISLYERFSSGSRPVEKAIMEFGLSSLDFSILSEVECRNPSDLELCLSILEIKYIRELDTLLPSGYNSSLGGEALGIPPEYITTDSGSIKRFYKSSKHVLLYDASGDFVEEFESLSKLAYDKGVDEKHVGKYLDKKLLLCDKWFVKSKKYDYAPKHVEVPRVEIRVKYKDVIKERIVYKDKVTAKCKALKYDADGNFCGEYDSKQDALRSFTNERSVPWGSYRRGYIVFKKKGDDYPKKIEPYDVLIKKSLRDYYIPASELSDKTLYVYEGSNGKKKVSKLSPEEFSKAHSGKHKNLNNNFSVAQYKLDDTLVRVFPNIRDAAEETGFRYSSIYACVKGITNSAKGFIWRKVDSEG